MPGAFSHKNLYEALPQKVEIIIQLGHGSHASSAGRSEVSQKLRFQKLKAPLSEPKYNIVIAARLPPLRHVFKMQ